MPRILRAGARTQAGAAVGRTPADSGATTRRLPTAGASFARFPPALSPRVAPGAGCGVKAQSGITRWTGLPRISTFQVVVSLPPPTVYSTCHQPSFQSPLAPYDQGSGMVIVSQ